MTRQGRQPEASLATRSDLMRWSALAASQARPVHARVLVQGDSAGASTTRSARSSSALEATDSWMPPANFVDLGVLTMVYAVGLHRGLRPQPRGDRRASATLRQRGLQRVAATIFPLREDTYGANLPTREVTGSLARSCSRRRHRSDRAVASMRRRPPLAQHHPRIDPRGRRAASPCRSRSSAPLRGPRTTLRYTT